MAQQQGTISHFSHPGHELVKQHYVGPFLCDMCWEDLSGPAYGCLAGCDFGIHESCAIHPQTLSSPAHHEHPLVLVQSGRDMTFLCDVCIGSCAAGCFLYRCPPCEFDMHPRCAPRGTQSTSSRWPSPTAACDHGMGRAWYYRCTACNVDFHVSCAATPGAAQMQAVTSSLQLQAALIGETIRARGTGKAETGGNGRENSLASLV
jgi:hypothetical protein